MATGNWTDPNCGQLQLVVQSFAVGFSSVSVIFSVQWTGPANTTPKRQSPLPLPLDGTHTASLLFLSTCHCHSLTWQIGAGTPSHCKLGWWHPRDGRASWGLLGSTIRRRLFFHLGVIQHSHSLFSIQQHKGTNHTVCGSQYKSIEFWSPIWKSPSIPHLFSWSVRRNGVYHKWGTFLFS